MKIFSGEQKDTGFGMIEMIVGAAVLSTSLLGISIFFQATLQVGITTQSIIQGDYLLEEGVEAVKLLRDTGYANNILKLSTTTVYYLVWNGTSWATSTTNTFIDGQFERKLTVTDVTRDANYGIAATGTYDPNIKLINVSVAWSGSQGTTTRSISTYVTNLFNN